MQKADARPTAIMALRMVIPSWFIFAGLLCAMLLDLGENQMLASVLFGAFLAQATYFLFFAQTISPLFPDSGAHMRTVFGIFAIAFLAGSLVFLFS